MQSFSVLMSVYRNDKPEDVSNAITSITEQQTLKPSEVILMVDGPVSPAMEQTIKEVAARHPIIKPQWQKENQGLGKVLALGLLKCSNELVARMDADDLSMPTRFEKQVAFMERNTDIAVLGGQISEFIDNPENIVAYRRVPLSSNECRKFFRDRDPLNHMTVMFRKSAVLDVGNYKPWHLDEDTFLWGRLLEKEYKIANLSEILVNVRVGKDMYARRGGWKYFKSDSGILKWKLDHGLIDFPRFLSNYVIRFTVQVILPNKLRAFVFQKILRANK